jgi:hypothetical protein
MKELLLESLEEEEEVVAFLKIFEIFSSVILNEE